MKSIYSLILILFSLVANGQNCDAILLSESFAMDAPADWTGDFNMLGGGLVEGWLTNSGSTTTLGTGPEVPAEGTHYLYMESSGPATINSIFAIQTPSISIPVEGSTVLDLSYLMYGSDIGSFSVEVLANGAVDTLFLKMGEQHSSGILASWEEISLDLSSYGGTSVQVQFSGMKLLTGQGDIAIDNVVICTRSTSIPTMGEWSLIILLLLIVIAGLQYMRPTDVTYQDRVA